MSEGHVLSPQVQDQSGQCGGPLLKQASKQRNVLDFLLRWNLKSRIQRLEEAVE